MAERMNKAEKRIKGAYSRFAVVGLVVGLVALLATVASVVIVLRSEKTEVAAQVLACDKLTTYHPDLEAKFTYEGEAVTHLWKLKVRFVNSGDKTIVGVGNQANIIGKGLNFAFPDDTRILRIEEEADTFDSTIVQTTPNHFQIQFPQWRSGEYSIVSLCIASDEPLDVDPLPMAPTRDIVDGDLLVGDLTERIPLERVTMIDRLPRSVSLAGRIMGGISAGGLALLFIILLALAWRDTVKKSTWKRRYLSSFDIYLNRVEPKISKRDKALYREMPEILPDKLWANFEGRKASWSMDFDGKPVATIITVLLLFAAFGLSFLVLMLFPA